MKKQINLLFLTISLCLSACNHIDKKIDKMDDSTDETDSALIRVADKLYAKQNNEMAANLYIKVLNKDPENTHARIQLARLIKEEGYYDKAIGELIKVPREDSGYKTAQEEVVLCHIAAHKPDEGKIIIDKLLDLEPNNSKYHNLKGVCFDIDGKHNLAQEQYNEALRLKPNYTGAKSNLGLSLALVGQFDQSVEILNAAIKDPNSTARERQNLAVVYALKNDTQNAKRYFEADLGPEAAESNLDYFREYNMKRAAKGKQV